MWQSYLKTRRCGYKYGDKQCQKADFIGFKLQKINILRQQCYVFDISCSAIDIGLLLLSIILWEIISRWTISHF